MTNKAKAHCSVNNTKKFKTADAEEKGTDVKEEPDDVLAAQKNKVESSKGFRKSHYLNLQ